ncbi:unnamed protein product [Phaedon cochleariae]|uniref:Partial AB-hydrolase lipase domain-containing protein n=1 Tax=Phaedon cochleariae TaxID=80249 RepID=A0A9P0DAF1_PHACE|nr:unnamed protein product [Phaedon cochleariae]
MKAALRMNAVALITFIIIAAAQSRGIEDTTENPSETIPTVPELIKAEGYPVESHYVTTSDGYILNVHRIPHGNNTTKINKKVAFLQHGLLSSSADWVLLGPRRSLAFVLADAGYDVWMGNNRGNKYSRNHTTLDPDKRSSFWQFSWHEIGTVDVPETIDYVLRETAVDGVYYVGHSQGTTVVYVMCATKPEYNNKLKAQISLSPVIYVGHIVCPLLRTMANWEGVLTLSRQMIGMDEFLPGKGLLSTARSALCSADFGSAVCGNALFALCGFNAQQLNATTDVPQIMAYAPAGSSTKQLLHFIQEINSGEFRQFDYGYWRNLQRYGSVSPPRYDLHKVTAPSYLMYGKNDWLSDTGDVERAYK